MEVNAELSRLDIGGHIYPKSSDTSGKVAKCLRTFEQVFGRVFGGLEAKQRAYLLKLEIR